MHGGESSQSIDINRCDSSGNDKVQAQRMDGARQANKRKETSCVATSSKKRWKFVVIKNKSVPIRSNYVVIT
jgi:hypothetical protein